MQHNQKGVSHFLKPYEVNYLIKIPQMNTYGKVAHPANTKGKFVYIYKGARGLQYLENVNGQIIYFDTSEEAEGKGGNKCCWQIAIINRPAGN